MSNDLHLLDCTHQGSQSQQHSLQRYFKLRASSSGLAYPLELGGRVAELLEDSVILTGQGLELKVQLDFQVCQQLRVGDLISVQLPESAEVVQATGEVKIWSKCNQASFKNKFAVHKSWQDFLVCVRQFFSAQGMQSVDTPNLVVCPGMEPTLKPFRTQFKFGSLEQDLYLPTSPELHLKKLLAEGYTDIFEIKTCYRNQELSQSHEPEFLMLEWYRSFANLQMIKYDLQGLIEYLAKNGLVTVQVNGLKSFSVTELFVQYLEFELKPETNLLELQQICRQQDIEFDSNYSWDDLFHLLFISRIETKLDIKTPILVHSYPASQAALARINEAGWAERFELYWGGFEIANAFDELTDPIEQLQRFKTDQDERLSQDGELMPIDHDFVLALERGIPPTGGIALGLERLFLACQGMSKIQDLRWFSII